MRDALSVLLLRIPVLATRGRDTHSLCQVTGCERSIFIFQAVAEKRNSEVWWDGCLIYLAYMFLVLACMTRTAVPVITVKFHLPIYLAGSDGQSQYMSVLVVCYLFWGHGHGPHEPSNQPVLVCERARSFRPLLRAQAPLHMVAPRAVVGQAPKST